MRRIFMTMSRLGMLVGVAAMGASAAAFYYGTGLQPHWWTTWLAPIPVLSVAPSLSRRGAFLSGFTALFLGGFNLWSYLRGQLGIPVPVVLAALALPAATFGLTALLFRFLSRKSAPVHAALAAPALWVSIEYLSAALSPHGTFGNLAYSQMNFLPVIQVASVTGIWGISFLVLLFAATAAVLIRGTGFPGSRLKLATSVFALFSVVLVFGWWRLQAPMSGGRVSVTLIAKDVSFAQYPDNDPQAIALVREYIAEILGATPRETDVVVLPEKIARVSENAMPEVDALFSSAAADKHTSIVVGLVRKSSSGAFNESRVYSPGGNLEAVYAKHHLIPGIEPEKPGTDRVLVRRGSRNWGLTVCKDMDFPELSRAYSRDGAALLLVPAWDFQADGWAHSRMAVLRNVEGGFSQARSARSGLLTASDNRGRVVAEVASASAPFATVNASVPAEKIATPYQKFGDWFAWVNMLIAAGAIIAGYRRKISGASLQELTLHY